MVFKIKMRTKSTALLAKPPSQSFNNTNVFPGVSTQKQNHFNKFEVGGWVRVKDPIRQKGKLQYKFFKPQKIVKRTKTTVTLTDGRTWSLSQVAPVSNGPVEDLNYFDDLELCSYLQQTDNQSANVPIRRFPVRTKKKTNKFQAGQ